MINSSNLTSSSSAYVKITQSNIIVNLIQLGTSMITRGYQQDLLLDPGTYSIDPDQVPFDATVSMNTYQKIFLIVVNRNGNMNIIVEFMIYIIFQI